MDISDFKATIRTKQFEDGRFVWWLPGSKVIQLHFVDNAFLNEK